MPPATSTDAAPKRKRLNQACDGCRRKKVRCDGERPNCRNCRRQQMPCVYNSGGRRSRTGNSSKVAKTPTKGKPAADGRPPTSVAPPPSLPKAPAVAVPPLSLQPPCTSLSSSASSSSSESAGPPAPLRSPPAETSLVSRRQAMVLTMEKNLEECIQRMNCSLNLGNTSGLTYRSPFFPKVTAPRPAYPDLASPRALSAPTPATWWPDFYQRLSPDWLLQPEVDSLLVLYFRFAHAFMPMVDEQLLHSTLATIRQNQPTFRPSASSSPLSTLLHSSTLTASITLVSSICAFATRFLDPNDPQRHRSSQHYSAIFEANLAQTYQHHSNLELIQALLIMAYHESAQANLYRSWNYSGQATRLTLGLGLNVLDGEAGANVPMARDLPTDRTSVEHSRRIFWTCFLSDRLWSLSLGYSPAIDEREICLYLPKSNYDWHGDMGETTELYEHDEISSVIESQGGDKFASLRSKATPGPDTFFIKLITLLGDILRIRNRSVRFYSSHGTHVAMQFGLLENALASWALSLPDYLQLFPHHVDDDTEPPTVDPLAGDGGQGQRRRAFILTLHAYYHTIVMFLYRTRLQDDANAHPTIPCDQNDSNKSFMRCYSAMSTVSEIARLAVTMDRRFLSPFLPFTFYHASLFLIGYADRIDPDRAIEHHQLICQLNCALAHTEPIWKVSGHYLRVLDFGIALGGDGPADLSRLVSPDRTMASVPFPSSDDPRSHYSSLEPTPDEGISLADPLLAGTHSNPHRAHIIAETDTTMAGPESSADITTYLDPPPGYLLAGSTILGPSTLSPLPSPGLAGLPNTPHLMGLSHLNSAAAPFGPSPSGLAAPPPTSNPGGGPRLPSVAAAPSLNPQITQLPLTWSAGHADAPPSTSSLSGIPLFPGRPQ
ncbi:hypothetical protein H4R33_004264 [Dimargaris cristalligena]|nr:hypothetical protein H4R33_004264 [Dimargaris cristalligena]